MKISCEKKKLFISNKALNRILNDNETMFKDTFRESELIAFSSRDYEVLIDKHLLTEKFKDLAGTTYYDENKTAYRIHENDGGLFGYRIRGDGEAVIKLKAMDKKHFRFEFNKFIQLLKTKNTLTGNSNVLTNRLYFIGQHVALDSSVNVVLGLFCDDRCVEKELLALPSRLTKADKTIVLLPTYSIQSMDLSKALEDKNIYCYQFGGILDDDFQINLSLISKEESTVTFHIPAITQKEKAGYKEHRYKRQDVIEFMQEEVGNRLIRLKINGNPPVDIRYSEVAALMLMLIKLKENNGGWVSFDEVKKDGIIANDVESLPNKKDADDLTRFHQLMSALRNVFKRHQCQDLLQGLRGKSQYRISTHPNRIKEPSSNWLKKTYKHTVLPALKASREGKND